MKNNVRSKTTARWSTILVCSGVLALSLLAVQPTQANAATDATNTAAVVASPTSSQESSGVSKSLAATPEETSEVAQTPAAAPVENNGSNETNPTTTAATDKYATSVTTSNIAPTGATVQTYSSDDANTDTASPVTYKPSTTASTDTSVTSYDAVITHAANQHPFSVSYNTATVDATGKIQSGGTVNWPNPTLTASQTDDDIITDDTTIVIPNVKTISNDTNLPTSFLQNIRVVYALDQVIASLPVTRTITYKVAGDASLAPDVTLPDDVIQTVTYLGSSDSGDTTASIDYYDPLGNMYPEVPTPKLAGYTADKQVIDAEWPMIIDAKEPLPEDFVVTVTYTPNQVTGDVTIPSNLGDKSGGTQTGNTGDTIQVPVPAVEGYTPDKTTVEAVINGDGTITATTPVTYTANSTGTTGGTTGTTGTGSTTPTTSGTTGATTTTPNAQTDANPTATPGTTTTVTTPTTTGTTSTNQNENEPTNSGDITKGPKAGQNTKATTGSTTPAGSTTTTPTGTATTTPTGATTATAPTAQASNVTAATAQNATTAATLPQTSETTANPLAVIGASLLAMLAGLFGFKIRDRKH